MGVLSHTLVALVAAAATLAALLNQPHLIQTAARLQPLVQQLLDAWTPPVGHRWNAHKAREKA